MGVVFQQVQRAVAEGRYSFTVHANERLRERGIAAWQVVAGLATGRLLAERPESRPNPTVEVEQWLADGAAVKAVWAWVRAHDAARLVTVHFR